MSTKDTYIDLENAHNEVDAAHGFYRDILAAVTTAATAHRHMLAKDDVQAIMDVVGDVMSEHVGREVRELEADGSTASALPDNHLGLVADAHATIMGSFRPEPINLGAEMSAMFEQMFRPRQLTNPATLQTTGAL